MLPIADNRVVTKHSYDGRTLGSRYPTVLTGYRIRPVSDTIPSVMVISQVTVN